MSGRPVCPQCGGDVEANWDWCHHCGFDPEGKKAAYEASLAPPSLSTPDDFAASPGQVDAPAPGSPSSGSSAWDEGRDSSPMAMPAAGTAFPGAPAMPGQGADTPEVTHPYADLPYSQSAPPPPPPPPPPDDVPAEPAGFGLGPQTYSPPSGASNPPPPPSGVHADPSGAPPAPPAPTGYDASASSFDASASFSSSPATFSDPGGPDGHGVAPDPTGTGAGGNNTQKIALIALVAVLVVVVLGIGVMKLSGSETTADGPTVTTADPNVPKPLGEISGRGTTAPGVTVPGVTTTPSYSVPTDGWVTYSAPDGSFQIDFPATPKSRSEQLFTSRINTTRVIVTYDVGTEGAGYVATYADLQSAAIYADSQAAFDDMNKASNNEYTQTAVHIIDGLPSVQYVRDFKGKTERGLIFIKDRRLYQVAVVDVDEENFLRFARSFHAPAA